MMKTKSILAAVCFAAAMTACNKFDTPAPAGVEFTKNVSITLYDSNPLTKATDGAINDATVFLYQKANDNEPVLWAKKYVTDVTSPISFELAYSDKINYTYSVKAFANMGELDAEVQDSQIKLADENIDALKLSGNASIEQADNEVTVALKRYVSKVSISNIKLDLPDAYSNANIVLKAIYLAKVYDAAEGGQLLNEDGYHSATEYNEYIYKSFDTQLINGQDNAVNANLYCYGPTVNLIAELEINGMKSYYNVPVADMNSNKHYNYELNVYLQGAVAPFDDLPNTTFSAIKTAFIVTDYDEENNTINFGEKPVETPEITIPDPYEQWARIQHKNGTLYTAEEWEVAEAAGTVTDADANGVAVIYSGYAVCPHIIHPKYSTDTYAFSSSTESQVIPGCNEMTSENAGPTDVGYAYKEVEGKANTDAILAAVTNGILPDAPAAQYCVNTTFANGQKGYLPANGEIIAWMSNLDIINQCMIAIGGDIICDKSYQNIPHEGVWSSTQYTGGRTRFYYNFTYELIGFRTVYSQYYRYHVRPVTSLNYIPENN